MPNIRGYRGKIGVVLPSTNTVIEADYGAMPIPGISNHSARLMVIERPLNTEEAFLAHVAAMRAGISDAVDRVVTCRPDHLIMGVALEAFWGGVDTATKLQKEIEEKAGVGVSMGGSATVAALQAFGARRVAVLTPHMPRGDEMVRLYLEEAGYDIVKLIGLKRGSALAIATTPEDEIRAALHELAAADAEAIVQVGTNLPMVDMGVAAERWLGKPVLCINPVTYWDALRRVNVTDKIYGHGSLLERH